MMRRLCLLISLFFCFQAIAVPATKLSGLQIKARPDSSIFVFTLTKKTYGRVKFFPKNKTLLIEFSNTNMTFNLPPTNLNNSNVETITVKKVPNHKIQFLFTLKQQVTWKVYYLPKPIYGQQLKLEVNSPSIPVIKPNQLKEVFNNDVLSTYEKINVEIEKNIVKKPSFFTVVIDAGHGGKDTGAIGKSGALEKRIVLSIANRLAEKINQSAHMRAVLTRKGDYFVPLRERLKLARKGEADIFIAIHADAYFDSNADGASIYALSKRGATSEAARWLAQRDNYSELGDVDLNQLKDTSLMLRSVLIDLAQTYTIQDSIRLGNKILDKLDDISSLHFKTVQQAPFVVLKSPDIPSILIETGFITNSKEEKRLKTITYQQKIADAIYEGINRYYELYGKHS